jgi:hypothetical protein
MLNKYFGPIFIIAFLVFSILAVLSAPLTKFLVENFFSTKSQSDWIGFAGNIVGGILGGLFTMLGVAYAFGLEKKKAIRDGIPNKILHLYILKEKVSLHKFSKGFHISTTKQESANNARLFQKELQKFTVDKNDLLERASLVDTDIFAIMDNYYKVISIIDLKLNNTLDNIASEQQSNINKRISDAAIFHTFVAKKAIKKIEEETTKYVEEFHKKRKSQKLLAEVDNHTYLS